MNSINRFNFISNIKSSYRERNIQSHYNNLPPSKCDTVSFGGLPDDCLLKGYDEVLIYDKTFNKNYNNPQFRDMRRDFDNWINKLKKHQVPKTICHDCSLNDSDAFGVYEIAPGGKSNPARVYYKILERKLIVLCCGDKNTQITDIARAKQVAKNEEQLRAFISQKSSVQTGTTPTEEDTKSEEKKIGIEKVKQKQQAAVLAGFKSLIADGKEDIENSQLGALKSFKEQLTSIQEEYPEDEEIKTAIESVDTSVNDLQKALDDLKVEEGDTTDSIETKILQTMLFADECKDNCYNNVVAPLLDKIGELRLNNLSNILEIREIYSSIRKQFKEIQAGVNQQKDKHNVSNILEFAKEFNCSVKRKADKVIGDKEKLDKLSLNESSEKLAKLKDLKATGDKIYEQYQENLKDLETPHHFNSPISQNVPAKKVTSEGCKAEVTVTEAEQAQVVISEESEDEKTDNLSVLSQTIELLGIEKEIPNITPEDKKSLQNAMQSTLETVDLTTVNDSNFNHIIKTIVKNQEVKAILDKYKIFSEPKKEDEMQETTEPEDSHEDSFEDLMKEYQSSMFLQKAVEKVLNKLISQYHVSDTEELKAKYISMFKKAELEEADITKETKILVEKAKDLKQELEQEKKYQKEIRQEVLRRQEEEAAINRAQRVQDILFEVLSTPQKSAKDSAEYLEQVINEQEIKKLNELDEMLAELD